MEASACILENAMICHPRAPSAHLYVVSFVTHCLHTVGIQETCWKSFSENELEIQNISSSFCFYLFVNLWVQNTSSILEGAFKTWEVQVGCMASFYKCVSWEAGLRIWEWDISLGFWDSLWYPRNRFSNSTSCSPGHCCCSASPSPPPTPPPFLSISRNEKYIEIRPNQWSRETFEPRCVSSSPNGCKLWLIF